MGKPDGLTRAVIFAVDPEVDAGKYPIKRTVGDEVMVSADVIADGHDVVRGDLLYRPRSSRRWVRVPLEFVENDRWRAGFRVDRVGFWQYTLEAWVDAFRSWRGDFAKRVEAGQDLEVDLEIGARLLDDAAERARGRDARRLALVASILRENGDQAERAEAALEEALLDLVDAWPDRSRAARYDRILSVRVDRERAGFSSWYEVFPRSTSPEEGRHGTLRDLAARLPYIAQMGFDIVYLPPVHPIGTSFRKGKNNVTEAEPGDVGSPWAIGSGEGGHKAVHPDLGTLEDFGAVVAEAKSLGMEIALDLAFQCSPDHPYVAEHPEWFRERPDGTIQYAENPPKRYQDIYPFDFECEDWEGLWEELLSVVAFWAERGVRVFRVDNPHTKPFRFWEWLIEEAQRAWPDLIFLAEAFTRPKVMYHLAKAGFTQSYTYFTWRHTREDFEEYLTELSGTEVKDYFRPNFWPNTPDILAEDLLSGDRASFVARLVLAATLAPSYGVYGPAFELLEHTPVKEGSEEYLDSEKYQLRRWDLDREESIREVITRVNRIRRENPCLRCVRNLVFHETTNDHILCYSKRCEGNTVLVVVNMEPRHTHSGWLELDLCALGIEQGEPYTVKDLLNGAVYHWRGGRNYVELRPSEAPAHMLLVGAETRREQDFEYYL